MCKKVHASRYQHKITLPFTSLTVSDAPDRSLKQIKGLEMPAFRKVSNSDFPLLCILLLSVLCHPYNQRNPLFLGAVTQLFSDIRSSWELGSLPTSCTCDWLRDIECKCVRCSVKSLAVPQVTELWIRWDSLQGRLCLGLSLCLPFQSIIKRALGITFPTFLGKSVV